MTIRKKLDVILLPALEAPLGLINSVMFSFQDGSMFKNGQDPGVMSFHLCFILKEIIRPGDWYYNHANKNTPIGGFPKVIEQCTSKYEAKACNDINLSPCYRLVASTVPGMNNIPPSYFEQYSDSFNKEDMILKVSLLFHDTGQVKLTNNGYVCINSHILTLLPEYK